jgi:type VI secretion system protein ImpJ
MKILDRVLWSEGMFLAPHHLQQLDRYHEAFTNARIGALGRPAWGVLRLELDSGALALGQVSIQQFMGVLPDGTPVVFSRDRQSADEPPPSRPIEGHFGATQRVLEAHLALKRERVDSPNVDPEESSGNGEARSRARFSVSRRASFDTSSSRSEEVEIAFGRKNLVLLFGDEPRDDYDSIKVAEIERGQSGALRIVKSYVPPALSVRASAFVMEGLDDLLARMTAKQRGLSLERRQRESAGGVEFQSRDITRFLQLATLNSFLPVIKHLTSADDWPTDDAYLALLQLSGQLSTFSGDLDPTTLPVFQYDDLGGCFGALFDRLRAQLEVTVRSGALSIALEEDGDQLIGELDDDALACGRFVLAVRTSRPAEETARKVPLVAKIAAKNKLDGIIAANASGLKLAVTHNPPPEVVVRPDTVYFTFSSQDPRWNDVLRDRAVAIYLPKPYNAGPGNLELLGIPSAKT